MFLLFSSCSPQEIYLAGRVIPVPLPPVSDTVRVTHTSDTLITGVHSHLADTVAVIKYFPGKEKFFYRVRLDTVYVQVRDTLYRELPAKELPFEYRKWLLWGLVTLVLTGLFYRMVKD
ncbi:MAG: hypothetical protein AB9882_13275 [Ignavibacteriaceae bacterium]